MICLSVHDVVVSKPPCEHHTAKVAPVTGARRQTSCRIRHYPQTASKRTDAGEARADGKNRPPSDGLLPIPMHPMALWASFIRGRVIRGRVNPRLECRATRQRGFFRVYLKVGSNLAPNEARFRGAHIGVDGESFGVPR